MYKRLLAILFVLFGAGSLKAQTLFEDPPIDIPLMNKTWELIAQKKFKRISGDKQVPVFPPALLAINNKTVQLAGYMVAIKMGMTHDKFMLAVVPINQCQFCGQSGVPDMVEVHMVRGIRYSDNAIKLRGKLVLTTPDDYSSNVFLVDTEVIN